MNGLFEKLYRSIELFKRSIKVIQERPKLMVFPVVTAILTITIGLFFLAPVALVLLAPHVVANTHIQSLANSIGFLKPQGNGNWGVQFQPAGTVRLALMYLLNMFVATMASVALNHEILQALNGQPVSISRGLREACKRWKGVLFWSLLAGLVGLIIRAIEDRLALVGRIIAGLIGLAWSVASIFAIPILARDALLTNPFEVLTRSAKTIKRTWGEALVGFIGMRGTNLLVVWVSILYWLATIAAVILFSNPWILLLAGPPWLFAIIIYSCLASLASRVYLCALYLYACDGAVSGYFDDAMMNSGWKMKKARA